MWVKPAQSGWVHIYAYFFVNIKNVATRLFLYCGVLHQGLFFILHGFTLFFKRYGFFQKKFSGSGDCLSAVGGKFDTNLLSIFAYFSFMLSLSTTSYTLLNFKALFFFHDYIPTQSLAQTRWVPSVLVFSSGDMTYFFLPALMKVSLTLFDLPFLLIFHFFNKVEHKLIKGLWTWY